MNSKGDKHLKTLSELSAKNNLTLVFLKKQIVLGRLQFEKNKNIYYSTQAWIEEYKKGFTFSGFMLDRVYPQKELVTDRQNKKSIVQEKKSKPVTARIVKEEKTNIDIEEAFVGKWNKEFKKINNQFEDLIKESKLTKKQKIKNDLVKNSHNVHSAVIAVAIMFLLSFYTVILTPNIANSFTKKIDAIIDTPYKYINELALVKIIDEEDVLGIEAPNSAQFSKYIKNKTSNISYPAGTTLNVAQKNIVGRVAGIDEKYQEGSDIKFIENFKKTTIEAFTKISDKQKRASLKLNDKLNNLISRILE